MHLEEKPDVGVFVLYLTLKEKKALFHSIDVENPSLVDVDECILADKLESLLA